MIFPLLPRSNKTAGTRGRFFSWTSDNLLERMKDENRKTKATTSQTFSKSFVSFYGFFFLIAARFFFFFFFGFTPNLPNLLPSLSFFSLDLIFNLRQLFKVLRISQSAILFAAAISQLIQSTDPYGSFSKLFDFYKVFFCFPLAFIILYSFHFFLWLLCMSLKKKCLLKINIIFCERTAKFFNFQLTFQMTSRCCIRFVRWYNRIIKWLFFFFYFFFEI